MEKARLFIALDAEDFVVDSLIEATNKLRKVIPGVRWGNESTMHLTLKFFGTIPLLEVREIDKAVKKSIKGMESFSFGAEGVGGFPSLEKPRVLWAGIGKGKENIEYLAERLEKNLQEIYGAEIKKFVPHITLGRIKRRIVLNKEQLHELKQFESKKFGVTTVDRVSLYSSDLTPKGPVYSKVDSWSLI